MKRARDSAEQIVSKLREADVMLTAERCIAQVVQALGVNSTGPRERATGASMSPSQWTGCTG